MVHVVPEGWPVRRSAGAGVAGPRRERSHQWSV